MLLTYKGRDITNSIDIHKAFIVDNAGGIADSVEIEFADTEGLWSKWSPEKNDVVELKESGLSSGVMYIDQLEQTRGKFTIKALSIPQNARTTRTRYWEKIRLFGIGKDISEKYGFTLKTYGVNDYSYERIGQLNQADLDFFAYRCILEGYILKIYNKQLIIYDEKYLEQQKAVKEINLQDLEGDFKYKSRSTGLYNSCTVVGYCGQKLIKSKFTPKSASYGPDLKSNIFISSQSEADRFSKGILRYENKKENQVLIRINLDTNIAAGNNINLSGIGLADGKYFITSAINDLKNKKVDLVLRLPLEGY